MAIVQSVKTRRRDLLPLPRRQAPVLPHPLMPRRVHERFGIVANLDMLRGKVAAALALQPSCRWQTAVPWCCPVRHSGAHARLPCRLEAPSARNLADAARGNRWSLITLLTWPKSPSIMIRHRNYCREVGTCAHRAESGHASRRPAIPGLEHDLEKMAEEASYIISTEHKAHYTSAGPGRLRSDASACPKDLQIHQ